MTTNKLIIILVVALLCSGHYASANNGNTYVFAAGIMFTGVVEVYGIDDGGSVSLITSFDIWKTYSHFADPFYLVVSPKGDSLFITDFDWNNGALYRINDSLQFSPDRRISYGCTGGSFTSDSQYFLTTANINLMPPKPMIQIYKNSSGHTELLKEQEVATTATITRKFLMNPRDEIFSSAYVGSLNTPEAFLSYQFNRKNLSLELKQYSLSDRITYTAAEGMLDTVVYATGHIIGSYRKNDLGMYELKTQFTIMPGWEYAWGNGVKVTPDGKYAVVTMRDTDPEPGTRNAGVYLFGIKPNGELEYKSFYFQSMSEFMDMTPDGKYFVVSSDWGAVITVFRINRTTNQMEVVHTMPHPQSRMSCMAFFPNKRPKMPVEEKNWSLYSNEKDASQKIAQKAIDRRK